MHEFSGRPHPGDPRCFGFSFVDFCATRNSCGQINLNKVEPSGTMTDIFLSYSRADRPRAQVLAQALESDGFSVWWDKVLRAGQTYDEVTETMLREAKVVIVLWSETSVKSKWVRAEATLGQRYCELVPAMIEDAERPIMFELVQTADLIGWDGDRSDPRWTDFVEDVKRCLEKANATAAAEPTAPAPAPEPASAPAPAPEPAAIETAPAPTPTPPSNTPTPTEKKKSSSAMPLVLGLLAIAGAGGYFAYQTLFAGNTSGTQITAEAAIASPACDLCPDMVRLETGAFTIGSPATERHHSGIEQPQTEITLPAFWISQTEVTWAAWNACVDAGGCRPAQGSGEGAFPVTGVSWDDASAYAQWLSSVSGHRYRLPSEAEWEYAARAGTMTAYWWGDTYPGTGVVTGAARDTSALPENPFGVSGLLGNVREWVADCYANNYNRLPVDGRASQNGDCDRRVVRGGSFRDGAAEHRAANRARFRRSIRDRSLGFRVVADQP